MSFADDESRQVELVYGEAYFDVSHSSLHNNTNFKVITKSQKIEVFGTEFNVKAYNDDDRIFTTLVNGKIALDNGVSNETIAPGQQAVLVLKDESIMVQEVDVSKEIAWKNGFFDFHDMPLEDMMKTLARWYDIVVEYDDESLKTLHFSGLLRRRDNINELLKTLEITGDVSFDINGNLIIIE